MTAASAELFSSHRFMPRLVEQGGVSLAEHELHSRPLPRPHEIQPAEFLLVGHPLEELLRRGSRFSGLDIAAIQSDERFAFRLRPHESGALAASSNPATSYANHCWTRDAMVSAFALYRNGDRDAAQRVVRLLAEFYGSEWQRERFVRYLYSPNPVGDFSLGRRLPMVRAPIGAGGQLVEKLWGDNGQLVSDAEDWGHKQLDAMGAWLWTTFRLANRGGIDPAALSRDIAVTNSWENTESAFVVAVRFLHRIQCWNQSDLGPWEEKLAHRRASSLGLMKAALHEMGRYFEREGWGALPVSPGANRDDAVVQFRREFLELQGNITSVVDSQVPNHPTAHAIETTTEGAAQLDVALAHLLFPVEADLTLMQQESILRSVYSLMGEVGFVRYIGDSYVGMDHIHGADRHLKSDTNIQGYRPAEWCTIDPLLAGYYFRRFIRSGGDDRDAYEYGSAHLRRALAQVTSQVDTYSLRRCGTEVVIPAGASPEAYFWDSHANRWRANLNTPLHWTASLLSLALSRAAEAAELAQIRWV